MGECTSEGEGVEVSYYHMLTFVGIQHFDICAILVFDLVTFRHYYVSTFFLSTKVGRILKTAIKVEWENLEQDIIDNALKSWAKRCRLIYYAHGSHIEHLLQ